MAYTPKDGSFSLFKNDRKEKDTHPDYKGDGVDLNGNQVWVSAWLKSGPKGTFMSCSMTPKEERQSKPVPKPAPRGISIPDQFDSSDIPF